MTRDVVIVGGGIAGLSAAWRLRHRDVLLLEAGDRLGGRMRSDPCGDYWLNYGAHLFPAPGTLVDRITHELGLETVPVTGGMMGLAVDGTILDGGRVESYPFRLPLSVRERVAFAKAGVKVQLAVRRYHAAPNRYEFENDRTFADFLGPLPPKVHEIFACAAHRATGELDELAAGAGIGLFALVWAGKGSLIARNLRGGTGMLPAAIGRELGERARVDSRVDAVREDGDVLVVSVGGEEIRARQVIMAANAPYAAPLVAAVAEQAADALSRLTYGAFLSVAIETNETTAMPYDGVYAVATPGRVFDMFTNQAHALRVGPRRPGGSLMLFAGAQRAAALMRESDAVIAERFLADLHAMYPQTRGAIANATVRRWELGNVYASPGRGALQPALEGALGAHENLHLAGDYFAELGTMEAAAQTGLAAAERVESRIREAITHV
ncbi:FAD-dependent oxidoreductase [Solirubrobacter phytolaccae]|uniref:FAD-dependent oxidoreductase n=1 Tax=Solirubrobacter phytolaccae TaxID=1404360 RepID=A0A9X3N9G0_9ACTN|nr:FAD-dependent oxidoreductase [Solirubrobacter phytolaccae]MDA0181919.1 FAD-dependent oxidoreductase [Solirubrobacter phytolaccae]